MKKFGALEESATPRPIISSQLSKGRPLLSYSPPPYRAPRPHCIMSKKRTATDIKTEEKTAEKTEEKTEKTEASSEVKTEVKTEKTENPPSAKKAMFAHYGGPAPAPLRKIRGGAGGKGNSNCCKIQGVVTRVMDKTYNQAGGPVVKKIIDIVVTNVISNNAGDVVKTGVPGMDYLFPSSKVDSPEKSEAGDGKFKASIREINMDETQIRKINTFSTSFYKESKDGAASAGVASVDVGSQVEMSGVCIDAVTKNGSVNFYRNAGPKLICLTDKPPSASEIGPQMIAQLQEPTMQVWSAFQSSANANGWFDTASLNPEQIKQASACQAMWSKVVESTADRLGAMSQGKDDIEESYFKGHEERVRAINAAKLASGDVNLFLAGPYEKDILPVLQIGMTASQRVPGMISKLGGNFEEQASLPEAFAAQSIVNLEVRGKAVRIEMNSDTVYDRAAAVDAVDKGLHNPVLCGNNTRVPFTVSLRDLGWSFGTMIEAKACMATTELLWSADFAAFPRMERIVDASSESSFPEGGKLFIDVPATLRKSCLKVSQKFIKDVLCGGLDAYIPVKQKAEDVTKLDLPMGVTELPYLVEHAYEELSSGSGFNIQNWENEGTIEFYVLLEGAFKMLAEDPELSTSTEKAEAYLRKMSGLDSNTKIRNFLASQGLVYAVRA